ncbi:MAG: alcohol dehydrogenase catalytic domain-containing protein [Thaumarchaeota archaeon]|jgi:propanol-preferring alcohol dehydrogenase|nr:alcohol dehydrogenase catalytic domain-containing protein [Nitrososphaerota archaeon]
MKAMKLVEFGKPLQLIESEPPPLLDDNVLVKVEACGVCHSDIHLSDGYYGAKEEERLTIRDKRIRLPLTLGHEVAGKVEAKGRSVTGFEVGERVVVYPWIGCGVCGFCRAGLDNLCERPQSLGVYSDGGYAEYVVVPNQRYVLRYDGLKPEEAGVLACSGITALQAVKRAQIKPDEIAVIIGAGGVGGMAIQLAKSLTASTVVVLDVNDKKLAYAKTLGADLTINSAQQDVSAALKEAFKGKRANAVIDFVGSTQTVESALKILGKGGRLVVVGLFGGVLKIQIPLLPIMAFNILSSYTGTLTDLQEMLHLASQGVVKPVISTSFRLDQANEALSSLRKGEIEGRAVIKP